MKALHRLAPVALVILPLLAAAQDDAESLGVCTASERAVYQYQVRQALMAAWDVPRPTETIGCTVIIAQNFRGEVLNAGVEACPEDPLIRKSVEDAAYDASPLPRPANRACQEPVLRLRLVHRAQPRS